jgi:hypothetical protein
MAVEGAAAHPGLPIPRPVLSQVVIEAPGAGPGHWAGAPSAVWDGTHVYLAYRLRRPLSEGRGHVVVVAKSADGVRFEPLVSFTKEQFGAESLERSALVRTPEGRWRLYMSCATYGTKHWRIELVEAGDPAAFDAADRQVVLPGDERTGIKDPAIRYRDGSWHLWASCHPLADPVQADRMTTCYATSQDGVGWTWQSTALAGRPGYWDARGTRITSVWRQDGIVYASYDGRASAEQNYEEVTGVAAGRAPGDLAALSAEPFAISPHAGHGLRYLEVIPVGDGRWRLYYEMTRPDGAHELRTELAPDGALC